MISMLQTIRLDRKKNMEKSKFPPLPKSIKIPFQEEVKEKEEEPVLTEIEEYSTQPTEGEPEGDEIIEW